MICVEERKQVRWAREKGRVKARGAQAVLGLSRYEVNSPMDRET